MLLLTESNALTLWNDCTYNAGAMLHINVGTPRPYICRFPIFVGFDKKLAASMKRKGMKGALKRVSP